MSDPVRCSARVASVLPPTPSWVNTVDDRAGQCPAVLDDDGVCHNAPRHLAPDRAAALQEVETLLRRIHDVTEEAGDVVRFYLAGDGAFLRDMADVTAADLASQLVDRVLGAQQDGGAASS